MGRIAAAWKQGKSTRDAGSQKRAGDVLFILIIFLKVEFIKIILRIKYSIK